MDKIFKKNFFFIYHFFFSFNLLRCFLFLKDKIIYDIHLVNCRPPLYFLSFFLQSQRHWWHDQLALHHNGMTHVLNYLRHVWLDHLCNELACLNFILYDTFEFLKCACINLTWLCTHLLPWWDPIAPSLFFHPCLPSYFFIIALTSYSLCSCLLSSSPIKIILKALATRHPESMIYLE